MTVGETARLLGVHANTVRTWTDQGLLSCLRINQRGDRRYRRDEIERFLASASGGVLPASERVLARTAVACTDAESFEAAVTAVALTVCESGLYDAASWVPAGGPATRIVGRAHADSHLIADAERRRTPVVRGIRERSVAAVPVQTPMRDLGTLVLSGARTATSGSADEHRFVAAVRDQLTMTALLMQRLGEARKLRRRADVLMTVGIELSRLLDPNQVLSELIDHAAELFDADHAAVFTRDASGEFRARASRNLSDDYRDAIERSTTKPVAALAFEERGVVSIPDVTEDVRTAELRLAFLREGINTVTVAPLLSDGEPVGALSIYHDTRHDWTADDLELLARIAEQGSTIIRNAENYKKMETWAAQLHSIQQLGTRLTRLRSVSEIGQTICTELNQLIDCHNIRVYRLEGDDCVPVAWRGEVGAYESEDGEQLRLKVGEGITGWVARHGIAQNLGDAAADERAKTIPGTEDNLDESLLLAPMLFDDDVIGVIVLAKLGLSQFDVDDLRVLEIYASIAAQAMANADATERLRAQSETLARQLNSQRELLRVTESILTTLDTHALLEEIAERLNSLVHVDNIAVSVHDAAARKLRTIFARGVHASEILASEMADDEGVSAIAIRTGEAQLVADELADLRVRHLPAAGAHPGALIVAPLRSGDGIQGLLIIERLGTEATFSTEEFDLVKLFAGHVSIALRNAAAHRAVELRAETDQLTGLWNHGALTEQIERLVEQRSRFSMLMVDLDYFKRYNDHLGHQAGNVMLQQVAGVLRESCRDSDLVFRFGGDEFAVLLPGTGLAGSRTVAEKVHAAVAAINDSGESPVDVTCSIGIAVYPKDAHDGTSLIIAADRACYAGKRAGRDRIATAAEGLALANEFRPTEPARFDEVRAEAYPAA
jgi:diguanylate cyclase (GGDEF)-like protein/excisionase family DNA binding protein